MKTTKLEDGYESDSEEVRVLLASEDSDEFTETDHTSLISGKDKSITVVDNTSRASTTSKKVVLKVYKRRWFILGLFSLLSFMQANSS